MILHEGRSLYFIAPTGGVVMGRPTWIGGVLCIPAVNAAEGEQFSGAVEGVCEVVKLGASGEAIAQGDQVVYDDVNLYVRNRTKAPGRRVIGRASEAAAATATTVRVKLAPSQAAGKPAVELLAPVWAADAGPEQLAAGTGSAQLFTTTLTIPGGTVSPPPDDVDGDPLTWLEILADLYVDGHNSTNTLHVEVLLGAVVVCETATAEPATGAVTMSTRARATKAGAAGTAAINSLTIGLDSPAQQAVKAQAVDWSTDKVVTVRATWGAAHASNLVSLTDLHARVYRA